MKSSLEFHSAVCETGPRGNEIGEVSFTDFLSRFMYLFWSILHEYKAPDLQVLVGWG